MAKGDEISDGEILFRFAKPEAFPPGQTGIPEGIFNDESLSCDWKKLRHDPSTSFHINEGRSKVVQIQVCDEIRNPTNPKRVGVAVPDWKQEIIHDPISAEEDPAHGENPAHALIQGRKKKPVVAAIVRNASIVEL